MKAADERIVFFRPVGHPFGVPRLDVGQCARVPPQRNSATAATLGDLGANPQMRPRSGELQVAKLQSGDLRNSQSAGAGQAEVGAIQAGWPTLGLLLKVCEDGCQFRSQ